MWDRQKTDIFNKIKAINPNAKASNYENKTANEMLKILQSYKNRSMKFKSSNKSNKSDKDNKDNSISNKDYDTDESTESKFGQGLEYYDLKDIDTKSFDILEKEENKLEEKASIDWNNYLTKEEVKAFLSKDDKEESAENIIYSKEFRKRYQDLHNDLQKKYNNSWTKQELVKDLENFYTNGHLITEGMHLVAYVRSPYKPGVQAIEDSDYASKTDFAKDLRANEFTVLGVNDNRDLYVVDNSDFGNLAQLKKKMKFYKMMWDDAKKENPESTLFKDDYERLKKIYDEAMRQPLNENYVLKGIQDGKSFNISFNDNKEKLQKFMDELQPKHKNIDMFIVEESKKIEALKPIKKGQMKILNIGGDGIAYKVSIQDAVRLQNAGYQIFLPQGSRKSIYARAGDIEDYNNGFNVDGEKLQENLKDIVLYHGSSNTALTYLDIGKSTSNGDQLGRGIYLTTDYEQAQSYAGNNGKVYKVKLDNSLKLFNLNDKLSDSIKQQLIKELENSNNKDIKNYICMFNRKVYDVKDKQEGLKFYQDKQKEWEQLDGKYFGNRPKVVKNGNNLQVIYTDYSDIQSAINNMTGENLIDTLRGDIDPDVFVTIITNSGYDGVITNNNHWYVIYKDINKVHILNENKKFGNKNKLEEVSRNDMLAKAKSQTITRYNKAPGYKGFSIVDIDTTSVFTTNSLRVTCRVGDYWDTVEMENILYWIQVEAEKNPNHQINTKGITAAIMNSIDGMDIKVDCTCPDFKYRFAYMATKLGYKYGKPENREAKITNPNDYGSICKHLISMLSNKKWLQQVTSTVMDFIVKRIDDVNKFLRVKEGEELTLPNELARQNAKKGFYTKLFGKDDANNEQDEENNEEDLQDVDKDISNDNEDSNNNDNTIDNQSNVDTEEDPENNEK